MYYSQAWWCIPVIPAPRRWKQRAQKSSVILKYMVSLRQTFPPNKQKHAGQMVQWLKGWPHTFEKLSLNAQNYIQSQTDKAPGFTPRDSTAQWEAKQKIVWKTPSQPDCCIQQLTAKKPYLKQGGRQVPTLPVIPLAPCVCPCSHTHHTYVQVKQRKQRGRQAFKFHLPKFILFKTKILYANII